MLIQLLTLLHSLTDLRIFTVIKEFEESFFFHIKGVKMYIYVTSNLSRPLDGWKCVILRKSGQSQSQCIHIMV